MFGHQLIIIIVTRVKWYVVRSDWFTGDKMGRTTWFDDDGVKKGEWTVEEDRMLVAYINEYGLGDWRTLPKRAGINLYLRSIYAYILFVSLSKLRSIDSSFCRTKDLVLSMFWFLFFLLVLTFLNHVQYIPLSEVFNKNPYVYIFLKSISGNI